jgi:CRISPR/Cas system-associated endoribonuclease Cas2
MMKNVLAIAILFLSSVAVMAQDVDKLSKLMEEREQLVMEYQFYNQQNSNFWGKKSKKDLLQIIETLKKIINKDSDLILAVKEASIKKIAESTVENQRSGKIGQEDQRNIDTRIAGLQSQVKTLQADVRKKEREMAELREQVKSSSDLRYGKDKVIAIVSAVAFMLLLYAVILQVRLNKALSKGKKK